MYGLMKTNGELNPQRGEPKKHLRPKKKKKKKILEIIFLWLFMIFSLLN